MELQFHAFDEIERQTGKQTSPSNLLRSQNWPYLAYMIRRREWKRGVGFALIHHE